ncbi:LuxR family transcriptional regulator [Dickeya dianthicola]|uniref:LuxR family transcriptional regulator n=1 Tax=Dickeya dianthicola TaxID=204039 RepID=A0AAP6VGS2_9GAMM|nr:LuxR family transcriptional regulator [Dickeya dianthicola]MBI0447763.1 LuxR family transcriptional regulator [Dickeya dianthicola]MBI0452380.1 LuxR family transcriptional regulator [Dickeya dianthicola]MBI0456478.1 LuxR family transcriptional regulator [Dickeya dianthicola]MBI0461168.1 LuxR family transcriptional regulator [Dickeya dianthicola]
MGRTDVSEKAAVSGEFAVSEKAAAVRNAALRGETTARLAVHDSDHRRAAAFESAFGQLYDDVRQLGFDALIYDYTPVPLSLEGDLITPSLLRTRNVPDDMVSLWCQSGYYQVDPVQIHALGSCAPFTWSYCRPENTSLHRVLNEQHRPVSHYMQNHNMRCGVTVPLHLPKGGFVTVTAIHTGLDTDNEIETVLARMGLLTHTFQEHVFPLFDQAWHHCRHMHLSPREQECLAWSAEGLTAKEIARKLHRSLATVNLHLNNAARKLGASNRVQAVVRAMHYRLL